MKESYRENLASHSGLEPYAGDGHVAGVASARGNAGQPLSSEIPTSVCRSCSAPEKATPSIPLSESHSRAASAGSAGFSQLAFRQTSFQTIAASRLQGLFNLREYLTHYVEPGREVASVAEIGVCIAEELLGEEIFCKLWESESQRTLRIQLPGATEEENHLAAALARVPWEIARPAAGQPTAALPQVETRLAQVAEWWQRHRSGQTVPEAPDAEILARVYISALDIGKDADYARQDWESALRRLDATLEVERALERPAEDIGATRFNRASVLGRLGRFAEARAELEACLQLFQSKPDWSAKVLGSLADLFGKQGDVAQAIIQQRRALALREQLPDPADRAISHNNLANCLKRHGTPSALAESPRHQLAALIYRLAAGLGQHLQDSLGNYAIGFRRARAAGTELAVPRVAELLADSAFHPLDQWLRKRQVAIDDLQAAVDQFLEQARQAALE